MEFLVAGAIAILTACGIYLSLRCRTFPVVLGLGLLSYAVNLFIVATSGGMATHSRPVATMNRLTAYETRQSPRTTGNVRPRSIR